MWHSSYEKKITNFYPRYANHSFCYLMLGADKYKVRFFFKFFSSAVLLSLH